MANYLDEINQSYVQFFRMHQYNPDELYRFYKLEETSHPQYGPGHRAYLMDYEGSKTSVQLPKKYLGRIVNLEEKIQAWKHDIEEEHPPFLIYRKTMTDKSYDIDILPFDNDREDRFMNHELEFRVRKAPAAKRKLDEAKDQETAKKGKSSKAS